VGGLPAAVPIALALIVIFVALSGFILFRWWNRLPWLEMAARLESERGSTNCGNLVFGRSHAADINAAVQCAASANASGRPFRIIFVASGIDSSHSSAIVGDSQGNAVEILFSTGMVDTANRLLRHSCGRPMQLKLGLGEDHTIPILNCEPWLPTRPEIEQMLGVRPRAWRWSIGS
jgi:hypothetical protein